MLYFITLKSYSRGLLGNPTEILTFWKKNLLTAKVGSCCLIMVYFVLEGVNCNWFLVVSDLVLIWHYQKVNYPLYLKR